MRGDCGLKILGRFTAETGRQEKALESGGKREAFSLDDQAEEVRERGMTGRCAAGWEGQLPQAKDSRGRLTVRSSFGASHHAPRVVTVCCDADVGDSQQLPSSCFAPVSCTLCGFLQLKALVLVFVIPIEFTAKGRRLSEVDNSPWNTVLVALKPECEPRQSYTVVQCLEERTQVYLGQGKMI